MQQHEQTASYAEYKKPNLIWLPLAIFIVGFFIATYLENQQANENKQHIQASLDTRLEQIAEVVVESVTLFQYGLKGLGGVVMATGIDKFNYPQMQAYSQTRDIETEFSGANGFGLIRLITPEQQSLFTEQARQDRPDKTFDIRQLAPHQDNLFVIQYIEPEQKNQQAVGLDIGSEPGRRFAAIESAKHNQVRLTSPITLVQAEDKVRHGFLIMMPIYSSTPVPKSIEQRLNSVTGWTYASILIGDVLNSMSVLKPDVVFNITDVEFETATSFFQFGTLDKGIPDYHSNTAIDLFGRHWQLQLTAKQAYIDALLLPKNYQIFATTLGATVLLMLIVFSVQLTMLRRAQASAYKAEIAKITEENLKQVNHRLEDEVSRRTKEISEVSALQRNILEGAGYAIVATDEIGNRGPIGNVTTIYTLD